MYTYHVFLTKILFIFVIMLTLNKPLYWNSRRLVKDIGSGNLISVIVDRLNTASKTVCRVVTPF